MKNSAYSCPSCKTLHTVALNHVSLIACKNCGEIVMHDVLGANKPLAIHIPEDWSFIQIGTTGEFKRQAFKVVGRVRLQLRNDYKNFWSAEHSNGKGLWIAESFASVIIFTSSWHTYKGDATQLRSNMNIRISNTLNVKGEYVEKCEGISYQGEIGDWKLFRSGFFLVQGSHPKGSAAVIFTIESKENIEFIEGEKSTVEILKLKNILEWDEWK